MKMIGIIFSDIYNSSLGELTKQRALASLPFGGRYRLVDFVLSNMANSGLESIGVITRYNYQSLMDHLGSCEEWDLNRKNGRVFILPPFGTGQTSIHRGKLQALGGAKMFLERAKGEYVLLSSANIVCNIDYQRVLEDHIKSGADLTVVCNREKPSYEDERRSLVFTEEDGQIKDVTIHNTYDETNLCGMGMFVMKKSFLQKIIKDAEVHGLYHFERDFVLHDYMAGNLSINLYEFKKSVLRSDDLVSYYNNNLKLLEETVRRDIFMPNRPIYTKVRDEVPTFYTDEAITSNALIADGCIIKGKVEESVLFRDILVDEGAEVSKSVVMQGTTIGKGAKLEYCIIDKDVTISDGRTLIGAPTAPIVIQKGQKI